MNENQMLYAKSLEIAVSIIGTTKSYKAIDEEESLEILRRYSELAKVIKRELNSLK